LARAYRNEPHGESKLLAMEQQIFPGSLECKFRLARLTLGPELAERVYPESSTLSGY